MKTMALYTQEQIERANNIDIGKMLIMQGEKLKKKGKVWNWLRHDSTMIYENKWYRFSAQRGGGPIQFMQEFYGFGFREAVAALLMGEQGQTYPAAEKTPYVKPILKPPQLSKTMHRAFAYLVKTRKIDADVVQYFVDENKIAETEEHHNIAFIGYDAQGKIGHMHLRGTNSAGRFIMDVEGSDKKFTFRHIGTSDTIFAFEAPIDMLSFICLNKENWQQYSYVCLNGVGIDALENVLEHNPYIKNVYLCLDNDKAGIAAIKRIGAVLDEKKIQWNPLIPNMKDWNQDWQELNQLEEQQGNFDMRI